MQRMEAAGISWLNFQQLLSFPLKHGVFLRHGGVSLGPYSTLNFGGPGETKENVAKNTALSLERLGISKFYCGKQSHGKEIIEVTPSILNHEMEGDALMTNVPGIGLMIRHADCQAGILYDPLHHAVAIVHSGWRGSVQNIYQHTINKMKRRYGTKVENLFVGISPSLGPHKAEFIHYKKELPEAFWGFQIRPHYFDFWEISRVQLLEAGVFPDHIEIAGICTYENEKDFFSHRRNPVTGRNATVVALV